MASVALFCQQIGIDISKVSKTEIFLLEAELFTRICKELKEVYRQQHRDYFHLLKFTTEMENTMLEASFVRFILRDILSTEEYNLAGIAYYTDTHEDIIQEVIDGRNTSPSAILLRRSIELHRSVRQDLYHSIIKKIASEQMAVA